MRLVTFVNPSTGLERVGILENDQVADATSAYASLLRLRKVERSTEIAESILPPRMIDVLRGGQIAMDALREVNVHMNEIMREAPRASSSEQTFFRLGGIRLRAPIPRPGKIIHTAGNFREHAKEGADSGWEFPIPKWISFLKSPSAVIGPDEPIVHPDFTKQLDHEIELAIVIGKTGKYIKREEAFDYVAGYTIFNDITARDIQKEEMRSGLLNFGKNLDTFAPFGPCLALKDSIPDVHNLKMELRVNGDVRQSSNTNHLSVTIPEIIEHYSWVRLEPGDILTTGTVSGVAAFRKPDPTPYFLKPGDMIEMEIEGIGMMRNPVVADKAEKAMEYEQGERIVR